MISDDILGIDIMYILTRLKFYMKARVKKKDISDIKCNLERTFCSSKYFFLEAISIFF